MPMRVFTALEICLREKRDILMLTFLNEMAQIKRAESAPVDKINKPCEAIDEPWKHIPERNEIIRWLDSNTIAWEPCFYISPNMLFTEYDGTLYLDVAPNADDSKYQQLLDYLEDESGRCHFPGVGFWLISYEDALRHGSV